MSAAIARSQEGQRRVKAQATRDNQRLAQKLKKQDLTPGAPR